MDTLNTQLFCNESGSLETPQEWRALKHQVLQIRFLDFRVQVFASQPCLFLASPSQRRVPLDIDSLPLLWQFAIVTALSMPHHKGKAVLHFLLLLAVLVVCSLVMRLVVIWLIEALLLLWGILVLCIRVHLFKLLNHLLFLSKSFSISILRLISSSTK